MVKEIVDVLDRIEALENVKPQEQTSILSANKPIYQETEAKKNTLVKNYKTFVCNNRNISGFDRNNMGNFDIFVFF